MVNSQLFCGGDTHSPTFPTDTCGPSGNATPSRIDWVVTLDPSMSSVQNVSSAVSNRRRSDHNFEHSDHLAVEAEVHFPK